MRPRFFFRKRLQRAVIESGITGIIDMHGADMNIEAIKRLLKGDDYVDFDIKVVHKAVKRGLTYNDAMELMATSLGIDGDRFTQPGAAYISPERTLQRLSAMVDEVDKAIVRRTPIALGTGHPGSMLEFYLELERYIREHGGVLLVLGEPIRYTPGLRLDSVGAVTVISDRGSLLHTHDTAPFKAFLASVRKPGLVIADHGFAGAAINAKIKTIGIHDVDDAGIPLAEALGADVLGVPMNDNQLNVKTNNALRAILADRQTK